MSRRIYLASSWRNKLQPFFIKELRAANFEVYDFRHPVPGDDGFAWSAIDPQWQSWSPGRYVHKIKDPIAQRGYGHDKLALDWCDTCVLLLPCGRSAHLEAGYCIGKGKRTIFYLDPDGFEPELMYLLGDGFASSIGSLIAMLKEEVKNDGHWQTNTQKAGGATAPSNRADT